MGTASATEPGISKTVSGQLPSAGPPAWSLKDGLLVWRFLIDDPGPWLVVDELPPDQLGILRYAVPRPVPQAEWPVDEQPGDWEPSSSEDEWDGSAARDAWHERAVAGNPDAPIPMVETLFDVCLAEVEHGRAGPKPYKPEILRERMTVVRERDLLGSPRSAIADEYRAAAQRRRRPVVGASTASDMAELDRRDKEEENAAARPARLLREVRPLLNRVRALPWAAFSGGKLPERWWETEAFAAEIVRWRAHGELLAYRHKWEQRTPNLSDAELAVYLFLHAPWVARPFEPATLTHARLLLEADARASDAFDVVQWVARLESAARPGCVDPHQLMFDLPELPQAWSKARGDGETQRQGAF